MIQCSRFLVFHLISYLFKLVLSARHLFSTKNCPFLDIGQQQIMGQVGTDQATWLLIRASFRTKRILAKCYRQMTGGAMSLVAYGPFTDKMKISDPTSHDNVNHFWKMLSMVIPGSVTQPPFVAGNATNVSKGIKVCHIIPVHYCTLMSICQRFVKSHILTTSIQSW